ncbi:hypothetical protein XI06_24630 [Bradyrhizobium sp. CCBAU 11434]|uniref:hypothetical protein n=1 Tax=Bradyrhizobium sp. CCBAU 11434 TaxID=1630885 RepID=UPI0023063696|nr:hypothetical protein [Bradyrhizobium sp. CCBAU 11434]MDA9523380.1 hypothetical protein [Bradyrhizobium sp. CCBAU 11434]
MSFVAQVQCEDGTYYELRGEGGNIHVYRIGDPLKDGGLRKAFDTIPDAFDAIQIDAGSNVLGDTYELHRGDDEEYWPDDDDD